MPVDKAVLHELRSNGEGFSYINMLPDLKRKGQRIKPTGAQSLLLKTARHAEW
jgi:hypothetical protein